MGEFTIQFHIVVCPVCQDEAGHTYHFTVRTLPIFGGTGTDEAGVQEHEVVVACPKKGTIYKATIEIPRLARQKIVKVEQK